MARIIEILRVPAPLDDAFDLVADFTSTGDWDPGIRSARRSDDGPIGLGSRFEVQLALGPLTAPLTYEITRTRRSAWASGEPPVARSTGSPMRSAAG